MKKLIVFMAAVLPGVSLAQNLSINVAVKHAMSVAFPGEVLAVTVQVKQDGKNINILPDELLVNGVENGNAEFGTISKTAKGIYQYTAPATLPGNPVVAVAASIRNANGGKTTAVKNINIIARRWEMRTIETTEHTCGPTNAGASYKVGQTDKSFFEIGDDLFVKSPTQASTPIPQQIESLTNCSPDIARYELTPGKGEAVTITSGKLNIRQGYISFTLNGTLITSDIGTRVFVGGALQEDHKPDEDIGSAPFTIVTPALKLLTQIGFSSAAVEGFWQDYTDNTNAPNLRVRHWLFLIPQK